VARLFRFLPALAIASAILATIVYGTYFWASVDALSKESSRFTAHMGSFRGLPVASQEEVDSARRLARLFRYAGRALLVVFVVSTATSLWLKRGEDWPWLSALAFVIALGVLGHGIAFAVGGWPLPIVLGVVAAVLASAEIIGARGNGRRPSIVSWAALGATAAGVVANIVHPRGF
jgi:hypothetical protein